MHNHALYITVNRHGYNGQHTFVNALFVTLVGRTTRSKHTEARFLLNLTDLLLLQLAQMPRSPDLAIFVSTITTMTQLITYPLCSAWR